MNRTILPSRPLRLKARWFVKFSLLGLLASSLVMVLAIGAVYVGSDAMRVSDDRAVWERGIPADATIEGHRSSRLGMPWLMASYSATVRYHDDQGAWFHDTVELATMFGGPDTTHAELRYDPNDHKRFAISWAVEATGARYRGAIVFGLGLAVFAAISALAIKMLLRFVRRSVRVAREGDEIQLAVLSSSPVDVGQPNGKRRYRLQLVGVDPARIFVKDSWGLLPCSADHTCALGLWIPGDPQHVLVIEDDLSPLVVTDAERLEIAKRIGTA